MVGIFINCDILESRTFNYAALTEDGISMKKLLAFLVLPLLLTACDSGDNEFDCTEGFPDGECLAEEMSDSCFGFFCETDPPVSVFHLFEFCTAVDCSTLDCGDITFTELERSDDGTITSDVFLGDQNLGTAECGFFQE